MSILQESHFVRVNRINNFILVHMNILID